MTGADDGPFAHGLPRNAANHVPLTPVSFLERSALVYPDKVAVRHGRLRHSYREFERRCRRLASALSRLGVGHGDTVAVMAPNVPALLEAHYAVPALGAVLNPLNVRLDAGAIAFCLEHGGAKVLLTDAEFAPVIKAALALVERPPLVIDIDDSEGPAGERLSPLRYEDLLAAGDPAFAWPGPRDEWDALALLYTSGTTGDPKGVVYHHRGAYLNALGSAFTFRLGPESVYLWTLPMFHCCGWTYTWAVTAAAATHVCLRRVDPALIFPAIRDQRVTHLYGLTESYGPATMCAWQDEWASLSLTERAQKMARQGVPMTTLAQFQVGNPETGAPVPRDGVTLGEVMLRGNTIMKGYLRNDRATAAAFAHDWCHSGDLAVWHPDNYIEIKDRSKDIIISGGENISSLEVEECLYRHPQVMEAAVVARPDAEWGETPCAFVMLKPDAGPVPTADIVRWCRARMAHFKVPKTVVFGPLPKTATGKIQKFVLRERARALDDGRS